MIRGCGSVNFTISSILPGDDPERARTVIRRPGFNAIGKNLKPRDSTTISIDDPLQIMPISRGVIFRR